MSIKTTASQVTLDATTRELENHALHRLFNPNAVAVIGASTNPAKVGNRICRQLSAEGFSGAVIPVGLKPGEIAGVQVQTSLRGFSGSIDVAVITTATEQVAQALRECAEAGVKFAIIHTAGFSETGAEGRKLEQELVAIACKAGIRLVGPNCMQMFNASARLNLVGTPFPHGSIAMVSQSGNLVRAVTEEFTAIELGFSSFVTVGNQADLKIHDYLDYLKDDPQTKAIFLYVEGLAPGTGRAMIEVAREAVARKPVVLLKGGMTNAGARSSVSHTGALAGEARVFQAAMRQAGVIMADRLDEVVPMMDALSRLPLPCGRRVAVVGGGGGHATICADALEKNGLKVPELSPETQERVSYHLPSRAGMRNPIDFTGASEREIAVYAKVPEIVLEDDTDAALLYGLYAGYRTDLETPGNSYVETSELIVDMMNRLGKPVVMQTVYARHPHPSLAILRRGGVPVVDSVEHAAVSLAALSLYSEARARAVAHIGNVRARPSTPVSDSLFTPARGRSARNLTEEESFKLLEASGVSVVPHRVINDLGEARSEAKLLGYPVVFKALDPEIIHKSDVGGVVVDLRDETALDKAYARISSAAGTTKGLIATYRPNGIELIIGGYRDPTFGSVLAFGLGGTNVEVLNDVTLRVLPITKDDASDMLESIRSSRLLGPLRGRPSIDKDAVIDMLCAIGMLMTNNPEIAEIDLNPVLAFPSEALVADARIILARKTTELDTA